MTIRQLQLAKRYLSCVFQDDGFGDGLHVAHIFKDNVILADRSIGHAFILHFVQLLDDILVNYTALVRNNGPDL
jgi:hypothetical protein